MVLASLLDDVVAGLGVVVAGAVVTASVFADVATTGARQRAVLYRDRDVIGAVIPFDVGSQRAFSPYAVPELIYISLRFRTNRLCPA